MSGFAGEKDSGARKIKMSLAIIGEKRGLIRLEEAQSFGLFKGR